MNGRMLLALFGAIVLINAVVFPTVSRRMGSGGATFRPLDLRLSYSADDAYAVIGALTPDARRLYAIVELSIDMIYPVVYAFFFFVLVRWLLGKIPAQPKWLERAALVPFAAMLFDWLENIGIVAMIARFPDRPGALAPLSSAMTTLKWVCFGLMLALVLYAAARWVISRRARAPT